MNKNNNKSFLSFSFSKGFISPNIPIATFYQGDKEVNFIIDTGSDDNVINKTTLSEIQHEMTAYQGTLSGIGGTYDVQGCKIELQYGGENILADFVISDNLQEAFDQIRQAHGITLHGMLGSKFLKEHKLVLDFHNLVAYNRIEYAGTGE